MTITPATHVADIVAAAPATIAVFQRHHIEFCCGGHVPLAEICTREGLDVHRLIDELTTAVQPFEDSDDWQRAPLPDLVAHIQTTYHEPLYEELPRLSVMLAKVVNRHGDRLPGVLLPLQSAFAALEQALTLHMRREDAILFPAIVRLATQPDLVATDPHPLQGPISVMEADHASAEDALATMRSLTSGYEPPVDACPTFRGLYFGLDDLEHRMGIHVGLEDRILFPRALELGRGRRS